jgi:Asp-tRNA(Asn)/Glu-tRNA(Gln) amidotransferase A subunit family amidase
VVDRLMAGALIPASWYLHAQRFRRVFRERVREVFGRYDVLLAPTTPCPAIQVGQQTIEFDGKQIPARPNLGVFTQPISFLGLPVVAAPVREAGKLPLGVQIIGAPYREANVLRVARQLELRASS